MRVAIIGSGISGLVAAHHLAREHEIELYEAGAHVGGHTHTHQLELGGREVAVDTGFIVFNRKTYPNFCRLLDELGVASKESDMSFSVREEATGIEWNGRNLDSVYAQRSNVLRPSFHRMVLDILRFNREAPELLENGDEIPLGEYLRSRRYSESFQRLYILPMGAAIWSASPEEMLAFPARFFVRFFHNHGFLQVEGRPMWRVVEGGSARYVEALIRPFRERVHVRTPVRSVRRRPDHVEVELARGVVERFDEVVIATHSDTALALLADPTPSERSVLGAIRYQENDAVLHTDEHLLPKRRKVWASWNYHLLDAGSREHAHRATLTYWMNRLQGLELPEQLCVTLNHTAAIDPSKIVRRMTYHHPHFDLAAVAAQRRWHEVNGQCRTWFAGAYWRYGFHEDGVLSGLRVVEALTGAQVLAEAGA
ncbi:MAG: FAD-dependent oxidoreductase [Planctomycetaceae bacterium]|nr:FAD-dependent oxidoreductase [Planctomycetaceae bacterium]